LECYRHVSEFVIVVRSFDMMNKNVQRSLMNGMKQAKVYYIKNN